MPLTIAQPLPVMRTSIARLVRAPQCPLLPVRARRCNRNENESVGRNLERESAGFERAYDGQGHCGSGTQFSELALRRIARRSHSLVRRVNISVFSVQ